MTFNKQRRLDYGVVVKPQEAPRAQKRCSEAHEPIGGCFSLFLVCVLYNRTEYSQGFFSLFYDEEQVIFSINST